MNTAVKILSLVTLLCASGAAWAQPPAPERKATAQSEAGEPRADTSQAPSSGTAPAAAAAPVVPAAPARPAPTPSGTPAVRPAPGPASNAKTASKIDRLELGTATVTGEREQPKVMYIVPWKRSDIGDLTGKPMNSLVDEILAPVDRDVFKREVLYYHAVQADTSQNGAPPKPAQQGEK
jgi:hypothetical protein